MFLEKLRLDERVALVMGAGGGGMGTQTSLALAEAGATVVAVDLFEEQVRDTQQRIEALGGRCIGFTLDARDQQAVERVVEEVWQDVGPIHHLLNLVGGSRSGEWYPAEDYPLAVFDRVIEFNLRTQLLSCQQVGKRMIANGIAGSIVNFASIAGVFTLPYQIGYGAGKAAVINLTRTLAVEWGPHGIRVNAIAPGGGIARERPRLTEEGEVQRRPAPEADAATNAPGTRNPLGRRLGSDEVSAVALFLVSDLASAITGQTITVDAGVTSRMPSGDLEHWARFLEDA